MRILLLDYQVPGDLMNPLFQNTSIDFYRNLYQYLHLVSELAFLRWSQEAGGDFKHLPLIPSRYSDLATVGARVDFFAIGHSRKSFSSQNLACKA